MEERVTRRSDASHQRDDDRDNEHHPIAEYSYGELVVQFPKDQIYRVPPPENALYVEQQQKPAKEKKRTCCGSCCIYFFITLIAIFLVLGIAALLITIFLKPKAPEINIEHFVAKNLSRNMEYDAKLSINNEVNERISLEYVQGGLATLSFKNKNVAKGPLPEIDLTNNSTASIKVVLGGSNHNVPKEIAKGFQSDKKSKAHVSFLLKLHMPSRTKFGTMKFGSMTYDVSCKFKVDSLAKGNRILSQNCVSQVQ